MKVSIFGSSLPQPGSLDYQEAYELGKLLATAGYTILTGGYIGTMEAASRGAFEAGGHVIGVTCADIESWRPVKVNSWVHEERHFITLKDRLEEIITACEAAIALPGGPGTLTEIALTWNLMVISKIPPMPLILVGENWKKVMGNFLSLFDAYIPKNQQKLIHFVKDIHRTIDQLDSYFRKKAN